VFEGKLKGSGEWFCFKIDDQFTLK
jgi:hypothetical protein